MSSTVTDSRTVYSLEGTLLEICSCGVLCPCFVGEDPDGGECAGVIAYRLDRGEIEGVDVAGLSIAVVAEIPGNALQGGWRVVMVVDDRATEEQEQAMLRAFGGELGGFLGDLAGLVDEVVAVERATISHGVDQAAGSFRVDGMIHAEMEPIVGANGVATTLQETAFTTVPGAPAYAAKTSRFEVDLPQHGMTWTIEGKNAVQTPWRAEHTTG
ncbi:MAG: DUF1326 domain-containing protein [Ilumatobacter sp.]|nr:MAG: DUF1326 domain-containing protein [Ilumatobacter sp.]